MKNQKTYLHIKSMSQLKIERARLESEIKMKEALFSLQYSRFNESMRIGNLISSFITRISLLAPLILRATQTFKSLYAFILSQFKSEKQEQSYSQEEEPTQKNHDSQEENSPQESYGSQ